MVDSISGLAAAQLKNVHNYAKSIQVAKFGEYYASFARSVDYYGTELVVKPILRNTPDWVADNKVVTAIQNNRVASILGSTAVLLLFLILIHPNNEPVDPIKKPDPAAGSGAVNGTGEPNDAEEAEESDDDDDAYEVDSNDADSSGSAAAAAAAAAAVNGPRAGTPPPASSSFAAGTGRQKETL